MRLPIHSLLVAAVAAVLSFGQLSADEPVSIEAISPAGTITPMFDGMTSGTLEARLVLKDAMHGNLILKNLTDEPLNVSIPEAFGAKQILGQGFGGGFGGGGGGFGGGGQGGGAQQTGGGTGGTTGGAAGGLSDGGGFFSIPPMKVKSVSYKSVCLEHGKTEPKPKMTYVPVPLNEVTTDPTLQQLIIGVSNSRSSTQAMQAAAWHLSDGMSWQELAAKTRPMINQPDVPYFSRGDLLMAQEIVAESKRRAEEAEKNTRRL